ncbi:hypothetical protein F5I97DRAFT_1926764 [Phlebopus sp. FC_14]|nr:hypothetical protein F5I97DRAFT_1926764 [Phlebopus sp. FC_14]
MPVPPPTVLASTTTPVFEVDLNNAFGPVVVGLLLACGLFGASCVQTLMYFIVNPTDELLVKVLVILDLLLCAADIVALSSVNYTDLVLHFGNVATLGDLMYAFLVILAEYGSEASSMAKAEPLLTVSQPQHLKDIWRLNSTYSDPYRLPYTEGVQIDEELDCGGCFCECLDLIRACLMIGPGSIYTRYPGLRIGDCRSHVRKMSLVTVYHRSETKLNSFVNPSATSDATERGVLHANDIFLAVTDLLLAALMAYNLYQSKSASGTRVRSTEKVISTLIAYSIATGALTGAIAMIGFILALADSTSTANQAMYAIIPHMYSNAMLASLNLRQIATKPWRSGNAVELSAMRTNSDRSQSEATQTASTPQNSKILQLSLNDSGTYIGADVAKGH